MLVNRLKSALIATASAGALFLGLASPASAGGIVFTWNPSASDTGNPAPDGGTGLGGLGPFTADNFTGVDYAHIDLSLGLLNVAEHGIFNINAFQLGVSTVTTAGLGPTTGSNTSPGSYQLYVVFDSVSKLAPDGSHLSGVFTSLTYSLYGDPNGDTAFAITGSPAVIPTVTSDSDDLKLASGSLAGSVNSVDIDKAGIPTAHVTASFVPDPSQVPTGFLNNSFFVLPLSYVTLDLESQFGNTSKELSYFNCADPSNPQTCADIVITAGTGSADFIPAPVPEPITLSMFGMGLLGMGFMFRRRNEKAAA